MSTRSQIRFRLDGDDDYAAQVYRHSDGYPTGVLGDLHTLRQLLTETGTHRGPDYAAANFIFLMKLRGMGLYADEPDNSSLGSISEEDIMDIVQATDPSGLYDLSQPGFLLGYGVENVDGIHGDEEYLYVVDIPKDGPFSDDWEVKVSNHNGFPRWDGPTDEAFSEAEWEFTGPLDDALKHYG